MKKLPWLVPVFASAFIFAAYAVAGAVINISN